MSLVPSQAGVVSAVDWLSVNGGSLSLPRWTHVEPPAYPESLKKKKKKRRIPVQQTLLWISISRAMEKCPEMKGTEVCRSLKDSNLKWATFHIRLSSPSLEYVCM